MRVLLIRFFFVSIMVTIICCCQRPLSITGDWVNPETKFFLSFTDSTVAIWNWSDFLSYRIEQDVVISKKEDTIKRAGYGEVMRITVNAWDTLLRFQRIGDTLKIDFFEDTYYNTVVQQKLYRLAPKNTDTFDSILFVSTMYFGNRPAMELMIHSDGRTYYHGKQYAEKQGYYSGLLSKNMFETILTKFRQVDFDKMDSNYMEGITHAQSRHIVKYDKGKRHHIHVYGFEDEPLELNILFRYLMELYKVTDLKEVSPFTFMDIEKIIPIIPMPPPIPTYLQNLDSVMEEIAD